MDIKAKHSFARISARKAMLVADLIRGKSVDEALVLLEHTNKRAAYFFQKLLKSAVANAAENEPNADVNDLIIKKVYVEQGPTLKRWRPRAQGRAMSIKKRTSHLNVVLDEAQV